MSFLHRQKSPLLSPWAWALVASVGSLFATVLILLVSHHAHASGTCAESSIFPSSPGTTRVCPQEVMTPFRNPRKGWLVYGFKPVETPANAADTPLASAIYTNDFLWSDLEPSEGVYRWDLIDTFIVAWKGNKKIKMGIMLEAPFARHGKEPIPDWVRSQIQGGYYTAAHPTIWEPKYTDPVFIQKYQNFLNALAQRYYNTPADPGSEDWQKNISSVDINTFGPWGEWYSGFAFRKENVAINPYVTATNTPVLFSIDDFTVNGLALDTFSRTVTDGWGSAEAGGAYAPYSPVSSSEFGVNGSEGTIDVTTANAGRVVRLASLNAHDVDIKVKVKTNKTAVGGSYFVDLDARLNASGDSTYIARLYFLSSGYIQVEARSRIPGGGVKIGSTVTLPGLTHTPGTSYWFRVQAMGSNPTTINLKVWKAGTAEPSSWNLSVTDNEPALQENIGDEKYNTLKTFVDQYLGAFTVDPKPELKMNVIGSSANGPTTLQQQDVAAVRYAVEQGNASMIRRMIGFGDANLKPDEIQYIGDHITSRQFDGEWGAANGNISWLDNPNDQTPLKQTYEAIDQALGLGASFLGWHKNSESIVCGTIPPEVTEQYLPEKSQCVNPADIIVAHPLDKLYPGTNETLRDYFQRRSGYRFFVSESVYPAEVLPGQSFTLQQAWYQRAVAKLYRQHFLRAYLVQGSTRIPLNSDLTSFDAYTWSPGPSGPHAVTSTFTVPSATASGTYTLEFAVVDASGNPAMNLAIDGKNTIGITDPGNDYSSYVVGAITILPPDTIPPTVSITAPANGSNVPRNSTVTITASASDVSGITKVEFRVNGTLKCTDTATPFSCAWIVPNPKNVTYTLQAKAYDSAGNTATSSVQVTSK